MDAGDLRQGFILHLTGRLCPAVEQTDDEDVGDDKA